MRTIAQPKTLCLCLLAALGIEEAAAAKWEIKPEISFKEIYSDNIFLESSNERDDLVTDVSPSIVLSADGNRIDWQLNYGMQNLIYADHSDRNDTNHRLQSRFQAEVIEDWFFVDANARVGQQLVNIRDNTSRDQVSGAQNSEDVYSYSLKPYIKPKIGNILEGEIAYTYDYFDSENDNGNNFNADNSTGESISASFKNGTAFGRLYWDVSYTSREIDYDQGDETDVQMVRGSLGYQLNRHFSLELNGTDEDNEFIGDRGNSTPEDSFYGGGFAWHPSRNFRLSLSFNKRSDPRPDEDEHFVSGKLSWTPSARTQITADVGNRFFGDTYNFTFDHQMRRSSWKLVYSESVSDFREQFLTQGQVGTLVCPLGVIDLQQCRVFDPNRPPSVNEQLVGILDSFSSIANDTYINKRLHASWSIRGARNVITLGASNQRREFVADSADEREFDISLSWSYRIAPKTVSLFSIQERESEYEDGEEGTDVSFTWSVTTDVGAKSKLAAEIYYSDRDADTGFRGYSENRVTVSFQHFF